MEGRYAVREGGKIDVHAASIRPDTRMFSG